VILYMLDTDIASYLIKGQHPQLQHKLLSLQAHQLCISAISKAELVYGLKRLPANHHLHVAVKKFFEIIRVLDWPADATTWYADIRLQLVSKGAPIGDMDMMIAAHALSLSAVLVSNNQKHYKRIAAPLLLENWLS
jgi:tRNA(fMet)-specific endonuclease VapC